VEALKQAFSQQADRSLQESDTKMTDVIQGDRLLTDASHQNDYFNQSTDRSGRGADTTWLGGYAAV